MHKMADDVQSSINIPLLHIVDATAEKIISKGLKKVGLLGTKFTMEEDFYKERLRKFGLEIIIPEEEEREIIHTIIFKELCLGEIKESSRKKFKDIIENLISKGAEGIILGCTEIPLLIREKDCSVPVFDTTRIHAQAAVEFSINEF